MARPTSQHSTELELEILKILWRQGPQTPREMRDGLVGFRDLAYTSVVTIMNIMVGKGYLGREKTGSCFIYKPRVSERVTTRRMLRDLVNRVFGGSPAGAQAIAPDGRIKMVATQAQNVVASRNHTIPHAGMMTVYPHTMISVSGPPREVTRSCDRLSLASCPKTGILPGMDGCLKLRLRVIRCGDWRCDASRVVCGSLGCGSSFSYRSGHGG